VRFWIASYLALFARSTTASNATAFAPENLLTIETQLNGQSYLRSERWMTLAGQHVGHKSAGVRAMKACSRETALRLKRFEVTEKGRKVAEMETMIADFERVANDLMRQIAAEEKRTGIKDRGDCAYSTFASAARLRRDNLLKSAEDLKVALYAARREHENTAAELSRLNPEATRDHDPNLALRLLPL
jgi:hypothetical protein